MSKQQILSYHNKQEIKDKYVSRMVLHISQDDLIQGETGDNGKGCLIWCTLNKYSHQDFSDELGLDLWIPKFLDRIFEGMQHKAAQKFSLDILRAIPLGIKKEHTDMIRLKILHYLLTEILPKKYQTRKETAKIISMFEDAIKGITITPDMWKDAADAAYAAADAYAAAAADADAAADAAYAAADAADAADAAADAADAAARRSSFEKIGLKLVTLFEEVK